MHPIPALADLGQRIMVNGPSNAGKSTLADAMARKLGVPVVHLDRFSHQEEGKWVPRPKPEFHALHEAAIAADTWIMDGNYSEIMPPRFARATGVVVIDDHVLPRYLRYFNRTLFQRQRIGGLESDRDSLNWMMINWIWKTRNAEKYRIAAQASGLPLVFCRNRTQLQALYDAWGLTRRG